MPVPATWKANIGGSHKPEVQDSPGKHNETLSRNNNRLYFWSSFTFTAKYRLLWWNCAEPPQWSCLHQSQISANKCTETSVLALPYHRHLKPLIDIQVLYVVLAFCSLTDVCTASFLVPVLALGATVIWKLQL